MRAHANAQSQFLGGGSLLQRREWSPPAAVIATTRSFAHDFTSVPVTGVLQRQKRDDPAKKKKKAKPAKRKRKVVKLKDVPAEGECTQTIGSEGSCAHLAAHTSSCCDPGKGIFVTDKPKNTLGEECPSQKWTPRFACDKNCETAIKTGCNADDKYLAIPSTVPDRKNRCGETYTVCAKGKHTTAVIRDMADKRTNPNHYEGSPAVLSALGVSVARSFAGKVYGPGTAAAVIAGDTCCNPAPAASPAPTQTPAGATQEKGD